MHSTQLWLWHFVKVSLNMHWKPWDVAKKKGRKDLKAVERENWSVNFSRTVKRFMKDSLSVTGWPVFNHK